MSQARPERVSQSLAARLGRFYSGSSTGPFRSLTTRIENGASGTCLSEQNLATGNSGLATATLELLACITFRQPISQAEIDQLFDAGKGNVVKLRSQAGRGICADGRLHFAITEEFLRRLSLASLQDWQRPSSRAIHPPSNRLDFILNAKPKQCIVGISPPLPIVSH